MYPSIQGQGHTLTPALSHERERGPIKFPLPGGEGQGEGVRPDHPMAPSASRLVFGRHITYSPVFSSAGFRTNPSSPSLFLSIFCKFEE